MPDSSTLVLYDRDCGFCRTAAALVLTWDRRRRLRPLALQTPEAIALLGEMDEPTRLGSWHLVLPDGEVRSAGAGLATVLPLLPGGRGLGLLAGASPAVTERGYRWVVRHRVALGRFVPGAAKAWADRVIASRTP